METQPAAPTLSTPTVTAADAARAAGLPYTQFRYIAAWLPLLDMPNRRRGAWRRLSVVDVVRVAIAGRLHEFGFSATEAAEIIDRTVDHHISGLAACGLDLPDSFIINRMRGAVVYVTRQPDGGLDVRHTTTPDEAAGVMFNLGMVAAAILAGRPGPPPPVSFKQIRAPATGAGGVWGGVG